MTHTITRYHASIQVWRTDDEEKVAKLFDHALGTLAADAARDGDVSVQWHTLEVHTRRDDYSHHRRVMDFEVLGILEVGA